MEYIVNILSRISKTTLVLDKNYENIYCNTFVFNVIMIEKRYFIIASKFRSILK